MTAFVNNDAEDAWPKLIDGLLESEHYGERWGRHWLDVVRYADSGGYETDIYYRNAWRYRDYVIRSFNDDKPYDQFVQEQIAGDELWPDNLDLDPKHVYQIPEDKRRHFEARIGTGFYALGPRIHESGLDAHRLAYETLTDWVDTTASAFMGLTLACARCHDHKFDPFSQEDYFSLQAIFAGSREVELPLWHSMGEADWRQNYPRVLAVQEARTAYRQFLGRDCKAKNSPATSSNRKRQLLENIGQAVLELPETTAGEGVIRVRRPDARSHGHRARPRTSEPRETNSCPGPRRIESSASASSRGIACLVGCERRRQPASLDEPFDCRKQFALWLTRADHPLTARVMVNRVWYWHFGRGIVETLNDFGAMGQAPSHPELLDGLTTQFVSDGWQLKPLHRLIMNSAVYRQTQPVRDTAASADRSGQSMVVGHESAATGSGSLWDAVHATAGTINLAIGGPPVVPPLADDEIASLRDRWHWVVSADPAQHKRRGIYVLVRRNFKFPMFEVFDAPAAAVSCPQRDVTTVAPQALWGLNNDSVFQQATHFAARVVAEAGGNRRTGPVSLAAGGWPGRQLVTNWNRRCDCLISSNVTTSDRYKTLRWC